MDMFKFKDKYGKQLINSVLTLNIQTIVPVQNSLYPD